ncbi:MAG TPA: metallopeptidase family protein, partial [Methylocystis sp.]|nr:metallopeptidase family protein [Methylocystis sp.]
MNETETETNVPKLGALKAPTLADFDALAREIYAGLPSRFTRLCEGLVIHVEDFPEDDVLEEMECETEFDLLGL